MSFAGSPKNQFMTFINYIKYLSIDTTLIAAACEAGTLFKDFMLCLFYFHDPCQNIVAERSLSLPGKVRNSTSDFN